MLILFLGQYLVDNGLLKDSSDENAKIGWAEITLHDPDDEDVTYWPGRLDREWIHDESTVKDIKAITI